MIIIIIIIYNNYIIYFIQISYFKSFIFIVKLLTDRSSWKQLFTLELSLSKTWGSFI